MRKDGRGYGAEKDFRGERGKGKKSCGEKKMRGRCRAGDLSRAKKKREKVTGLIEGDSLRKTNHQKRGGTLFLACFFLSDFVSSSRWVVSLPEGRFLPSCFEGRGRRWNNPAGPKKRGISYGVMVGGGKGPQRSSKGGKFVGKKDALSE